MHCGTQTTFHIAEASAVAAVRRAGLALGEQLDFDEQRKGELALLITEAATNIVKHAGDGEMLLRTLFDGDHKGLEIIALDKGPGIDDLHLQMLDGNSTTGTYGIGLGTIGRLSHEFEIYSQPNAGTVVWMRLWSDPHIVARQPWSIGSVCLPMEGEAVCGDAWTVEITGHRLTLMAVDGLGHGPEAAQAARRATDMLPEFAHQPPGQLLNSVHNGLRSTRGAALAIAQIDPENAQLLFAGIGNISVSTYEDDKRRHLVSHNGIAGVNLRKTQEFSQPWTENMLLIAHSDGINTRWDLNQYPDLRYRHPGLIAAVLYRDFCRGRDDVSVVVLRHLGF